MPLRIIALPILELFTKCMDRRLSITDLCIFLLCLVSTRHTTLQVRNICSKKP